MKKIVLASFFLVLSSFIKADLAISQNDLCLNSETKGIQKSLPVSDEAVVNQELVNNFSDLTEKSLNNIEQNLQKFFQSFNDYLKRPNDALDVFVKNSIDGNFCAKNVSLFVLVFASLVFTDNKIDSMFNSVIGVKFAISMFLKFLLTGIFYNTAYNGLRFCFEKILPVSYPKIFNEKMVKVYNRFPRTTRLFGLLAGISSAFVTIKTA